MFDFNPFAGCSPNNVATLDCIPNILPVVITLAITFAFIVSLILIVYSGIKFITSGGDEKQVEGAKKTLTYSIIGLIVVLSSFFIVQIIAGQTGVGCLTKFGFETCNSGAPPFVQCSDTNPPPRGGCRNPEYSCKQVNGHWGCYRDTGLKNNGDSCTSSSECRSRLCRNNVCSPF